MPAMSLAKIRRRRKKNGFGGKGTASIWDIPSLRSLCNVQSKMPGRPRTQVVVATRDMGELTQGECGA